MESLYHPLSSSDPAETRLVKIYPGPFDQVPRCELVHAALGSSNTGSERLQYICLSYTWGDPTTTANIRLNNIEFPVTLNLYSFLQHVQTVLYVVAKLLPEIIQDNLCVRHLLLQQMLKDPHFPRHLPFVSADELDAFIKHHVRLWIGKKGKYDSDVDNFHDFLYSEGYAKEPEVCFFHFWIDALCINQRDLDEKSQQIERMTNIYRLAPSMMIWLHDHENPIPNIDDINDFAYKLFKGIERWSGGDADDGFETFAQGVTEFLEATSLESLGERSDHFSVLFQQRWFTRAWVVQELVSAEGNAVVLLDFWPLRWTELRHMLPFLLSILQSYTEVHHIHQFQFLKAKDQAEALLGVVDAHQSLVHDGTDRGIATDLRSLLRLVRGNFTASKPHDLLYSLLGLLNADVLPSELRPDYGLPIEKVYHDYEVYMIRNTEAFGVGQCPSRDLPNVPSWVTDWRSCQLGGVAPGWARSELKHIEISQDMSQLTIDGFELEEVRIVLRGKICAAGDGAFDIRPLPMERTGEEHNSEIRDTRKSVEKFQALKAICLEHLSSAGRQISSTDFQEIWERFWPLYPNPKWQRQKEMMEGIIPLDEAVLLHHAGSFWYFCLISMMHDNLASGIGITSNGNIVVCNREDNPMEVGDSIWLLKGAERPWILRSAGSFYSLLGNLEWSSLDPSEYVDETTTEVRRITLI